MIEWGKKELTTENKDELKKNNLHSTLCQLTKTIFIIKEKIFL